MQLTTPLVLVPEYRDYVWGGERLRPGQHTAEMWTVSESDRVSNGPMAGRTLAEIGQENPAGLVGERPFERTGRRFPLLVKILDCADWLSLQVHPDDALAARLEGPDQFGKTEAWHVLEAEPGAELIAGVKPKTSADKVEEAIRAGKIAELADKRPVRKGETLLMPARTLHALGPGLLLYEVQQTSDITYRVYDWDRPATSTRPLHIDKSLAVVAASAAPAARPEPPLGDGDRAVVAECPYFTLELICTQVAPVQLSTEGMTFHTITVVEGEVEIATPSAYTDDDAAGETIVLRRFESAVVPAACAPYELRPVTNARVLKASVEAVSR